MVPKNPAYVGPTCINICFKFESVVDIDKNHKIYGWQIENITHIDIIIHWHMHETSIHPSVKYEASMVNGVVAIDN